MFFKGDVYFDGRTTTASMIWDIDLNADMELRFPLMHIAKMEIRLKAKVRFLSFRKEIEAFLEFDLHKMSYLKLRWFENQDLRLRKVG